VVEVRLESSELLEGESGMNRDMELLVGLSNDELEALADSLLAPSAQTQLDELLDRNAQGLLAASELAELDRLVARVDQLTVLKTRARYTLGQKAGATGACAHMFRPDYDDKFANDSQTAVRTAGRLRA
jgi:hypothetical protein